MLEILSKLLTEMSIFHHQLPGVHGMVRAGLIIAVTRLSISLQKSGMATASSLLISSASKRRLCRASLMSLVVLLLACTSTRNYQTINNSQPREFWKEGLCIHVTCLVNTRPYQYTGKESLTEAVLQYS